MKQKIKHIASIQTGIFTKVSSQGKALYLQAKYYDQDLEITGVIKPDIVLDGIAEKHLLRKGDILFAAKGNRNFATCFAGLEYPAVASTSFFVIRVHEETIAPEYLAWFLNQPNAMQFLKGKAKGTSIVSISKSSINDLEVSIPSIQKQRLILKIFQLRNREKALTSKIGRLLELNIQQKIMNAIK